MPQDALVDLTGAVGETIYLKDKLPSPDLLWKQMLTSNDQEFGALLTAGIFAPAGSTSERETELASGLYARHAYSITAVKVVSLEGEEGGLRLTYQVIYAGKRRWMYPYNEPISTGGSIGRYLLSSRAVAL